MLNQTHTYVVLALSDYAFTEILSKLHSAGYDHAFHEDDNHKVIIDMHGLAVAKESNSPLDK